MKLLSSEMGERVLVTLLSGLSQMQVQKSLVQYQKIPKTVVVQQHIGIGAGKFLGVRRIFARILPNLPEKKPWKATSKQKLFMLFWAPFLLIFSGACSDFQGFCEGFQRFCSYFHGFCPRIFTNSKLLGCALAPHLSHQWSGKNRSAMINVKSRTKYDFQNKLKQLFSYFSENP